MTPKVVLAGCGNMGGALLRGWIDRGLPSSEIVVVEPDAQRVVNAMQDVAIVASPDDVGGKPDVIVLAVKPQIIPLILSSYARFAAEGTVILSIAAGRTIEGLSFGLGDGRGASLAIVRAMPNTPAAIGRGISVACASPGADGRQRSLCADLLAAVGSVLWVDDESMLDAVTAVSGSGPAYVFLLVECLMRAGIDVGLPAEFAERLARETVAGAGELLMRSQEGADRLRLSVTSPGGTTAAALTVLMAETGGLQALMSKAVAAAARRSRELAS
ncbi:MAG: pyrroline-5-carboxylate reductase [Rhodospirillales bacterium]|nr:pyrroline-5-carboxylate reductase [Rhodospirillales bacterium]